LTIETLEEAIVATEQSTEKREQVELNAHQWNVVMDVIRVDVESPDAPNRLGDVASQAKDILNELERQLGRDGVERH
jgi:hypothetical protein